MDLGIKGRIAVVTGSASGIGHVTARLLLEEGARVALVDRDEAPLDQAARSLQGRGEIIAAHADLTDTAHVQRLSKTIVERLGQVDILVHAADVTGPTGRFDTLTDDDWREALDGDVLTAVRLCRAFIPHMQASRWGRVVLIASEDAAQPYVDELPYCAAKAATLNLVKGLSKTYASDGVLVNAVSPAFIQTPMTNAMMHKRASEGGSVDAALKEERPTLDLGRRGKPDEVGVAIALLCSARASFCTGANLRVDGGAVATMAI